MNRRSFLQQTVAGGLTIAGLSAGVSTAQAESETKQNTGVKRYQQGLSPWPICLNASTIRPTPLTDKIRVAAEAGYDAIEPWIDDLEKYEAAGGSLNELAKEIADRGMYVPNIIGLWGCMPATQEEFDASLAATRERMRRCAAIGSKHVAAIPAPDNPNFDLKWATYVYKTLLEIGRKDYNLIVAFEFVGFMKGIYRFGQAAGVAIDTDDPDACLIMDTFHLYRGGSGFNNVKKVRGDLFANFHFNDLPDNPPREQLGDEHRIYPGDGMLPLKPLLKDLVTIGYTGVCLE